MINTLLSQITGIFQKDFLFASFLPALILLSCIAGVIVTVFGVEYVFSAYEALTTLQQTGVATLITLMTVVVAYLLNSLRGTLIRIWSGESQVFNSLFLGPVKLAELWQASRYAQLRAQCSRGSYWLTLAEEFRVEVAKSWKTAGHGPGYLSMRWIMYQARRLHEGMGEASARLRLMELAAYFGRYSGQALQPLYAYIRRELTDWGQLDSYSLQRCASELDRRFGTVATVRATSLGNIIQAYNHYAYTRYCIEAEVFWPRLKKVVPEDYMAQVREPKILLDFAVAMATISVVVAFGLLTAGPWLWLYWPLWMGCFVVGILSAAFFYVLSVDAAMQYGDMIRSCFDLFRLELLAQLQFERPATLGDERKSWERVSQLIVYGQESDLKLVKVK